VNVACLVSDPSTQVSLLGPQPFLLEVAPNGHDATKVGSSLSINSKTWSRLWGGGRSLTRKPCYNSTPQTRSDLSAWREQPGAVQGSHCESCLAFFPRFGRWLSESERLCLRLRRARQASLMSRPAKATQRFSRANLKRSQLRGWGFLHTRGGFVCRPSCPPECISPTMSANTEHGCSLRSDLAFEIRDGLIRARGPIIRLLLQI
jgi:hypothetical protein